MPHVEPALIESCWHSLLGLFGRPLDPTVPISLTFYPYQNFIASRAQLRMHSERSYQLAYERLVVNGTCLDPPIQRGARGNMLHDSLTLNKETVAKGMEHLMHVIFGGRPLDAAAGDVANRYTRLPATRNCSLAAPSPNPACAHGL